MIRDSSLNPNPKGKLVQIPSGISARRCNKFIRFQRGVIQNSGQIIATSHDLTPNGGLVREIPLFQENLGW